MSHGQLGFFGRIDRNWRNVAFTAIAALAVVLVFGQSSPRAAGNFTPTIKLETSTSRAAAHPDARITIDNSSSSEALKDLTIDLPDGFMGSLNAAPRCSVADAQAANCPAGSEIGTVENYARVDNSDIKLGGKIYLTDALPPHSSDDPAGLQIVVPAKIGGVTLDPVVVNARVQLRHAPLPPDNTNAPPSLVGPVVGVRTIVTDIPRQATGNANSRIVQFSIKKLVVNLFSDQTTPYSKLLTNPSKCGESQISAAAVGYEGGTENPTAPYTVDQCDSVDVGSAQMSFTPSSMTPGDKFQFSTALTFADESPAVDTVELRLPSAIQTNPPAFGDALTDQCPITSIEASGTQNAFDPSECPAQAKVGTVEIETPLLPDPIEGELYFISASPIPIIGIYVDPTTGPNNPAGVSFGLYGSTSTEKIAQTCSSSCTQGLVTTFRSLPDVPLKKITVTTDGTPRGPLDGNFLQWAASSSNSCQRFDDFASTFLSQVDVENASRPFAAIQPYAMPDCNAKLATMTDPPFGGVATTNPPNFTFLTASTGRCAVDIQNFATMTVCNPSSGTVNFTPASAVGPGLHYFFARPSTEFNWRAFTVQPDAPSTDTVAPSVTIASGPTGTTSQTSPQWGFSADEPTFFQCSLDDGAFVPCDTATTAGTSGSFQVPVDQAFYAGTTHKLEVRGQDEAGNVGATDTASVDVEIDFDPSLTTLLTTTQARAHPDLDVTINSASHEDLKAVKLALPNGFFGGLTGVQTLCPIATASAGNCTVASQVGTVETEARVDDSLVRIDGQVYLTESAHVGEPAGLSIKVPAVIQDVDLGNIIVSGRLQVRGQAEGIDSLVLDIPDSIVPDNAYGDTETFFDMRQIKLKLRTGAGASQPLLTNPSKCDGSAFVASFTGDPSQTADSTAFAATGCDGLGFGPSLALSVVDANTGLPPVERTADGKSISGRLTATLSSNPGDAAIDDVSLLMPRPITINVQELGAICTIAEYAGGAGQCPAASRAGSVTAISPLLPEPLTGDVYLLRPSDPKKSVPSLLLALRGRINIDIIGVNQFENVSQIRTTFTNLPDVPLSSFSMTVDRLISTRPEACTIPSEEWDASGQLFATNGKTAPIRQTIVLGCKSKYSFAYRKRAKRSTLSVTATGGPVKMKKLTVALPKSVVPIKKALKKKLIVKADGKQLKTRCYKIRKNTVVVSLCGKTASVVSIRFRSGSLNAGKRAPSTKKLKKLSISATAASGKKIVFARR